MFWAHFNHWAKMSLSQAQNIIYAEHEHMNILLVNMTEFA